MDIQRLLTSFSSKIIVQFFVVLVVLLALIGFNYDVVYRFYFDNQLTNVGVFINGAILLLLFIGLGSILYHLFRYRREEASIAGFVNNVEALRADLMHGLPADSIVVQRQNTMRSIQNASGEINHGALASMLNADEATRFGLIRFINNILILTGVFGTIVSLSIALLGASDLLDAAGASIGGMGLVIHGMSTALSTTITAIVAYVLFGYFYTRLNDVQTHFLSGIEHLTSVYLLPQFVKTGDELVSRMSDLIKSVIHASDKLHITQDTYERTASSLQETLVEMHQTVAGLEATIAALREEAAAQQQAADNREQIEQLGAELAQIKGILREGFRLPVLREAG